MKLFVSLTTFVAVASAKPSPFKFKTHHSRETSEFFGKYEDDEFFGKQEDIMDEMDFDASMDLPWEKDGYDFGEWEYAEGGVMMKADDDDFYAEGGVMMKADDDDFYYADDDYFDDNNLLPVLNSLYDCVEEVKFMCYSPEMEWDDAFLEGEFDDWLDEEAYGEEPDYGFEGGWRNLAAGLTMNSEQHPDKSNGEPTEEATEALLVLNNLKQHLADARDTRHHDRQEGKSSTRINSDMLDTEHHDQQKKRPLSIPADVAAGLKASIDLLVRENGGKEEMKEQLGEIFRKPHGRPDGEVAPVRPAPHGRSDNGPNGHASRAPPPPPHDKRSDKNPGVRALQTGGPLLATPMQATPRSARGEVRAAIQDLIKDGDTKMDIRKKVEQRMQEEPSFKTLMTEKMALLRNGGGKQGGKNGWNAVEHRPSHTLGNGLAFANGGRKGWMADAVSKLPLSIDRPKEGKGMRTERPEHIQPERHDHERPTHGKPDEGLHGSGGRKLVGREKKSSSRALSECPNGNMEWLVNNLSPQCTDILFRMDAFPIPMMPMNAFPMPMKPPPPFFDGGGHHRGSHHRGGPHHGDFDRGFPQAPPPHGLGCMPMVFGIAGVVAIAAFFLRRCRKRRLTQTVAQVGQPIVTNQIPIGVIVQSGQPMPTGMAVNIEHGQQPQVITGGPGYPANFQPAYSGGAPLASVPTNAPPSGTTMYPANFQPAYPGGAPLASVPTNAPPSGTPTAGGVPIVTDGKTFVFAPPQQLSF